MSATAYEVDRLTADGAREGERRQEKRCSHIRRDCEQEGKGVNPSEHVKSRVFAPLSRALVGRGGARDVLGWTAVAQCPTLSAKYFSVSLKISICGLTNMAKSTTLPAFCRTVQW